MPVPAAAMFIALLAHVGGPLMGMPPPPSASMDITIADDRATVAAGQPLTYRITVRNQTRQPAPVTVRVTLSPISELHADAGTTVANAAAWTRTLGPGSSATYSLAAVVDPRTARRDLAATACLHLDAQAQAVICDTDLNTIAAGTPGERRIAWLAAILLGLLAVAAAVWLDRLIRPALLTPQNAAQPDGPAGQPGGAPPV